MSVRIIIIVRTVDRRPVLIGRLANEMREAGAVCKARDDGDVEAASPPGGAVCGMQRAQQVDEGLLEDGGGGATEGGAREEGADRAPQLDVRHPHLDRQRGERGERGVTGGQRSDRGMMGGVGGGEEGTEG